jgi:protein CpxP
VEVVMTGMLIGGLLLAPLGAAHAAPPERLERLERAMDAVSATETQRQTVRDILSEQLPHLQALRTEAHALHEQIHEAFSAQQLDRQEVGELRLELVDLFDRGTELGFSMMMDLAEVFTPEQRATLAELRAQRMRERAGLTAR